jgi:glycosyltransferase involved in cell wall biosynthesis
MKNKATTGSFLTARDFEAIPAREINHITSDDRPLVSVLMITRDHEPYLEQAVESIVTQQCDFSFELLIGEDCSRDRTREICEDLQKRYPEIIRLITSAENVGMHKNLSRLWHRARGRYLAMCEGDDYWLDRNKLATQAAWMDANPSFSMCGAYTQKIRQDDQGAWVDAGTVKPIEIKEKYTLEDLIPNYGFHFSSIMVRKDMVRFPGWFWDVYCADRPLYLLCAEKGPVGLIPQITSAYRLHQGGIWSPVAYTRKARGGIHLFKILDKHFNYRHHALIDKTLRDIIWSYIAEALAAGDKKSARKLYWQSIRHGSPGLIASRLRDNLVLLSRLYLSSCRQLAENLTIAAK